MPIPLSKYGCYELHKMFYARQWDRHVFGSMDNSFKYKFPVQLKPSEGIMRKIQHRIAIAGSLVIECDTLVERNESHAFDMSTQPISINPDTGDYIRTYSNFTQVDTIFTIEKSYN